MKRGSKFSAGQWAMVNRGPGKGTIVIIDERVFDSHWATHTVHKVYEEADTYLMDEEWMDLVLPGTKEIPRRERPGPDRDRGQAGSIGGEE